MLVARRYRISRRVQGVGFRFFAERAARQEGLGGWVRNCDDGSVEVRAEGDRESLLRFESHIRMGPPGARVESLEVADLEPEGRTPIFSIRG